MGSSAAHNERRRRGESRVVLVSVDCDCYSKRREGVESGHRHPDRVGALPPIGPEHEIGPSALRAWPLPPSHGSSARARRATFQIPSQLAYQPPSPSPPPATTITLTLRALIATPFTRSLHSSAPSLARRFPRPSAHTMDSAALAARLDSLSLSGQQGTAATPSVLSYFFTPKSGSVHPAKPETALKLVVVALEAEKNVGPAKQLAASAGLKDMRAIGAADLEKLIGKTKELGKSVELGLTTVRRMIERAGLVWGFLSSPGVGSQLGSMGAHKRSGKLIAFKAHYSA